MDIDQVRTFLAVAANGSFLEAAGRLHVTQSTVSARIQNLESDLGTRLFVRNRSGATLTPSGRRFLRHAQSLVLTLETGTARCWFCQPFFAPGITVARVLHCGKIFCRHGRIHARDGAGCLISSEIGSRKT